MIKLFEIMNLNSKRGTILLEAIVSESSNKNIIIDCKGIYALDSSTINTSILEIYDNYKFIYNKLKFINIDKRFASELKIFVNDHNISMTGLSINEDSNQSSFILC